MLNCKHLHTVKNCKPQAEEDQPLIFGPGPLSLTRTTKGSDSFLTLAAVPSVEQWVFPSWVWPVHTSTTHSGVPSSHLSNADQNPLVCKEKGVTPDSQVQKQDGRFQTWHPLPSGSSILKVHLDLCNTRCCCCYIMNPDRMKGFIYIILLLSAIGIGWG